MRRLCELWTQFCRLCFRSFWPLPFIRTHRCGARRRESCSRRAIETLEARALLTATSYQQATDDFNSAVQADAGDFAAAQSTQDATWQTAETNAANSLDSSLQSINGSFQSDET
jgi:hypothetical protein